MSSEEGSESLDTIMSEAIGQEPLLSFSRDDDSTAQFLQLIKALQLQEHNQGWPMLCSVKVQVQKCEKCSREYCSFINHRRHIHYHSLLRTLNKDAATMRDWLTTFWVKLSTEEEKEVVSFKKVALEGVTGSSIIKKLSALVRKPGFSSLPHLYLKAGSEILDIVQGRPSRFPVSSSELFTILDYASEKTFLFGSAFNVPKQRYVFDGDGDAQKTCLETKNLVACSSFLLEQNLINAWRADREAERSRFEKLLVKEEEAARKRRAEGLDKKRQKRLKQKEQKEMEKLETESVDVEETIDNDSAGKAVVKETIDKEEKAEVNGTRDNASVQKVNVDETTNKASVEKLVLKESIDTASGKMTDVDETIDYTPGKKTDVTETCDDELVEKTNVNEDFDEKVDLSVTVEASEEMPAAETSGPVACEPQIDAADIPNVDPHSSTIKHSNPETSMDSDYLTAFDDGQIDPGDNSPIDEAPFVQARGRRWRRSMSRRSGSHRTQGSQAPNPSTPRATSNVAQGSPASNPSVPRARSNVARGRRAREPSVGSSTSTVTQGSSSASKPAVASSKSYAETLKLSAAGSSSYPAPSAPVVAPSMSNIAQVSRAQRNSGYVAQVASSSNYAQAPNLSVVGSSSSPASRPALTRTSSAPRNHGSLRTVSDGHKVWSPKPKPKSDGPNEPGKTRKHEGVMSPTIGDGFDCRVQIETTTKPDQIGSLSLMIGSISVPLEPFIHGACGAQTLEPEIPDPAPRKTTRRRTVEFWKDVLVPNGCREPETESRKSSGIEIVPAKNLLENGDWESAMYIAQIFHEQRWKRAVASDHEAVVVVPDSERKKRRKKKRK